MLVVMEKNINEKIHAVIAAIHAIVRKK